MAEPLRVLCLHGVGNHHVDLSWQRTWQNAIHDGVHRWDPGREVTFSFPLYDDIFTAHPLTAAGTLEAALRLLGSGIVHGFDDPFRRRAAARPPVSERLRWTAGMVVQWAENDALRRQLRDRVLASVRAFRPDVICAHSLGSLATYDTFVQPGAATQSLINGAIYISFGSQIGNPFVRAQFAGRIVPLKCQRWFHLYNADDDVFTARIRLRANTFEQVDTFFDLPDPLDHDAGAYLQHANTVNRVWAWIVGGPRYRALGAARTVTVRAPAPTRERRPPTRRALLVGINDYPDPKDRLEGCVNDVFQVSAVLQECGFEAEDIRVMLDRRATAAGIRSRLQWLLEGAGPQDQRVFYYSGHGAQLPAYAADEKADHVNECLVPADFDWTMTRAITDDALVELYTQLDYTTHFLVMLDCCHSGGMTRDGGPRVRGMDPPDDIRHRALRWNAAEEMWQTRTLPSRVVGQGARRTGRAGPRQDALRLGRAARLRVLDRPNYQRIRTRLDHKGPYMPLILQACRESELAYEYRHGVIAYGAFTYALTRRIRDDRGRAMTFAQLCEAVGRTLADLGYEQRPEVDGPSAWVNARVPWLGRPRRGAARSRKRQ